VTREELASAIDGNEYRSEINKRAAIQAKESGLVVVYGASDDLVEFEGAISDEVGGPGIIPITRTGILQSECDGGDECPYFEAILKAATTIEAIWCGEPSGPSWTYKTALPHSTFNIMEDGDVFCRGIVFAVADIPE
jgi:hypothetical protein